MIHPYELLGITPSAGIAELRRAFYDMSLLCHPDKGGSADDMRVVLAAYRHILHEIQHRTTSEFLVDRIGDVPLIPLSEIRCESLGITPEEIRTAFDECLTARGVAATTMLARIRDEHLVALVTQDLFREGAIGAVGATPFQVYDVVDALVSRSLEQEPSYASIPGGYDDLMAHDEVAPLAPFGREEMILYKEPEGAPMDGRGGGTRNTDITKTSLPDYTEGPLLDYRRAYQEPPEEGSIPLPAPRTLEELELERAMQDAQLRS